MEEQKKEPVENGLFITDYDELVKKSWEILLK